ncbi:MAG: hypothetical protein K0S65_941 [Labilithrix sp.]|nr:hypothetical protein [Labilithrix sp.]
MTRTRPSPASSFSSLEGLRPSSSPCPLRAAFEFEGRSRQSSALAMGFSWALRRTSQALTASIRQAALGALQRAGSMPWRIAFVFILVVGLLLPGAAGAAPFDLAGSDWEGGTELVRLARAELGAARVTATTQIDFTDLKPEDGLILLYPERSLDVDELTKFMRAGGRVILLDDFGRGESLLLNFGMKRVPSPRQPAESLRHNPQLALAEPASAHPVVADVNRVVTNHPTGLGHPDLSPVLKIRAASGEPDVTVAVAGAVGQGRLLAVGDPSIVMNSMLRYSGNKTFARGLVRYAVDSDAWGKRGGRLFIAAGNFDQKGAYGGEQSFLSEWFRDLKDLLDQIRKEGLPSILAWGASIALGLALVVWVGSRAGRLHKPIVPRFIRRIPAVAQGGVAGHAAVIGAPQTTRVLAILELKSALEEQLTTMLGLSKVPGHQELLAQITERRLLDAEGVHTLRRLLLRMSNVETMVVFQRSGGMVQSVRDNEVVSMGRTVKQLLDAARAGLSHAGAA